MQDFKYFWELGHDKGIVTEINYPVISIKDFIHSKPHEIVYFEKGQLGEIFSIEKDCTKAILLSRGGVSIRDKVVRTDEIIRIPVSEELLGSIINPLGEFIGEQKVLVNHEFRELDANPLGISQRARIDQNFKSGTAVIDLLIPLGKGQRELVIGDRKTGKTAFILTAIKQQALEGTVIIYAAIGKKKSDIKKISQFFKDEKVIDKTILVASSYDDPPSMIYNTPYTAMTIAEYFRDKGRDVFIILDDLSTHAKFYREIALVAGFFPGRDSYPGDIFYVHARLLERAGSFINKSKRNVSITCLPIVEIVESDLTGYIPTNLMSMTDGHIFFDNNAYFQGRRPAVNLGLSVTRVGRQTQSKLKRDINHEVTAFLNNYERIQTFSHFGAELSSTIRNSLMRGEKLYQLFNQDYKMIVTDEAQVILFAICWLDYFNSMTQPDIEKLKLSMIKESVDKKNAAFFKQFVDAANIQELLEKVASNKKKIFEIAGIKLEDTEEEKEAKEKAKVVHDGPLGLVEKLYEEKELPSGKHSLMDRIKNKI